MYQLSFRMETGFTHMMSIMGGTPRIVGYQKELAAVRGQKKRGECYVSNGGLLYGGKSQSDGLPI